MSASGYVRQSASLIASGQAVASTPVNNEFNQLQAAFSGTAGHDHSGGTGLGPGLGASAFGGLTSASVGFASANGANSFNVRTLTGTSNRLSITNGTGLSGDPVFDISATYVGQSSLTTLGTIATGVWNGTLVGATYGGTGVNNGSSTLTLGSSLVTSGAGGLTLTIIGTTNVVLPTTGTLVNSAVTSLSSLATVGTITSGTWHGSVVVGTYGGTGVNNGSSTITLGGSLTTIGAFTTQLTATNTTAVTLPTTGTLLSSVNNLSDVASSTTAANNLLPTQTGNSGKFLTTDGAGAITWGSVSGASGGTVTSVTFTGDGVVLSSTPSSAVTSSGTVTATTKTATAGTVLGNVGATTAAPAYTAVPVLGLNTTTTGKLGFCNGNASGATVTVQNTACTSAYNYLLPATAGTSGQVLTSAGASAQTWTTIAATATSNALSALASQNNNTIVGNNSGSSGAPSALTISQVLTMAGGTKGQVLYCSATNTWAALGIGSTGQVLTVAAGLPSWATGGATLTVQTFTAGGTYTPTAGMAYCYVRGVGGGGGGGGVGSSGSWAVGGAGGAGSYGEGVYTAAQIGASKTVTVGAAGTAGTSAGGDGGAGGTTSLGVLLSCNGGSGGTGVNSNIGNGSPGAGGAAGSGGSLNVAGQTSCYGFVINGTTSFSAPGASSAPFGTGGVPVSASGGAAGSGTGCGGSGASAGSTGTLAGGAGKAGEIIIIEFQ